MDKYANFATLAADHREGRDYKIVSNAVENARAIIVAPHAGKIEPQTGEIAREIAGQDHSYYIFEGLLRDDNHQLHITSSNFDAPGCITLIQRHATVLSIHGCRDDVSTPRAILVGGLDEDGKNRIAEALRAAGFDARTSGHPFYGTEPNNICNRGTTKKGIQLEMARTLRNGLDVASFATVVRTALLP